uniref:Uncharacterized protein n=1 Tax=Arundo donax TaxID=35708 RepID=A0A0A9FCW3_ARUDO
MKLFLLSMSCNKSFQTTPHEENAVKKIKPCLTFGRMGKEKIHGGKIIHSSLTFVYATYDNNLH